MTATTRFPNYALADLFDLPKEGGDLDPEVRGWFAASSEAKEPSDAQSSRLVMDPAADYYFGATVATLGPAELGEIASRLCRAE